MRKLTTTLFVIVALLFTAAANATLIAYEPFDYAPTNSAFGLNGGNGWDGAGWYGAAGDSSIIEQPGLSYTSVDTLYTKGNKLVASISNNWQKISRDFSVPLNSDAGSTNWFSFITVLNADTNNYGQLLTGFQSPTDVNNIRFLANGYGFGIWALNKGGAATYYSSSPAVSNEVIFVVIEKVNQINSTQDYWKAWINPPVNQDPANYTGAFGGVFPASTISGVHFWKGGNGHGAAAFSTSFRASADEFRIGDSWDDVNTDEPVLVHTPMNESPTNYESDVSLTPTLTASAFVSDDGADSHSQSRFYVESIDGVAALDTNIGGVVTFTLPASLLEENTRYFWTVSYKGSHSTKWSAASDLSYFDTTYSTEPAPLAYEGVDYAETSSGIAGYAGGEGWRNSWNPLQGYNFWISQQDVVSPGLAYRLLEVTNNTFIARNQIGVGGSEPFARTNVTSAAVRKLQRDGAASLLTPANHFGGTNMTTWASGLIEPPVGIDPEKNSYSIRLRNSLGVDKLIIGKNWDSAFWAVNGYASDAEIIPGEVTFLVAKVVYTPSNSTASLWLNPTLGEEPSSNTIIVSSTSLNNDYSYDTAMFTVERSPDELLPEVKFDELRIGVNWQQVMPGLPSIVPDTPSNISPADATANIPIDSTLDLEGSTFTSESGDSLLRSIFLIESFSGVVNTLTGASETVSVPVGILQEDTLYSWKVRYFSSLSGLPSEYSDGTTFSTVWEPSDTPLAYDGADYPEINQIKGLNGGYGWNSEWDVNDYYGTNLPMSIEVASPGMMFDTLPVNGNAFMMDETTVLTNSSLLAWRGLKTGDGINHMMIDDKFGNPGSTNWFSFLAAIGADCTNKNFIIGVSRWNNWVVAGAQGFCLPDSDVVSWRLTGFPVALAIETKVKTNETALIVARFISGTFGETNGTGLLWVNPVLEETEPTIDSAVSISTNGCPAYDFISVVAQGNGNLINTVTNILEPGVTNIISTYEPPPKVKYDEIRFGDSWMGVTGVPEPGILAIVIMIACYFGRDYWSR